MGRTLMATICTAVTAASVFSGAIPPGMAQTAPQQRPDATSPSNDAIITITGCVQREREALGKHGPGETDEFVLTHTKLKSGRVRFIEQPGLHGVICRLAGQGESQFEQYVGHEMEITGFILNRKSVTMAASDAPDAAGGVSSPSAASGPDGKPSAGARPELPKINVSAFRSLSDRCVLTP